MFNLNFLLPLFVFAGIIILVLLTLCKHLNDLKKASSLKVNPNVRRQMINNGYFPYIIPINSSTNNYNNNNGTIFTTPTSLPVTIIENGTGTATTTATMISYPSSYPSTVDQLFINALTSSSSSSTSRSTSSSISTPTLIIQSQLNQNDSSDIYQIHKCTPPPKYDEFPPPCYEDAIAIDKNLKNSETSIAIEPSIPSKK